MKKQYISKGLSYVLIATFFWALIIVNKKLIFNEGENAYNFIFWTTLLASPYWVFRFYQKRAEFIKLPKRGYIILLLTGLLSLVGVTTLEALAIKNTQAINFSFLVRTTIIFTIIFEFIVFRKRITFKKIILSVLILLGIYLFVVKDQALVWSTGDLFTIGEAIVIAIGNNVMVKFATNIMSVDLSSSGYFIFGFVPLLVLCLFTGHIAIPVNWVLIILSVFFSITLTVFRYKAINETSASFVTMAASITPIWVTFLSITFLNESISPIQVLGGLVIVLSVFVVELLKIK